MFSVLKNNGIFVFFGMNDLNTTLFDKTSWNFNEGSQLIGLYGTVNAIKISSIGAIILKTACLEEAAAKA